MCWNSAKIASWLVSFSLTIKQLDVADAPLVSRTPAISLALKLFTADIRGPSPRRQFPDGSMMDAGFYQFFRDHRVKWTMIDHAGDVKNEREHN